MPACTIWADDLSRVQNSGKRRSRLNKSRIGRSPVWKSFVGGDSEGEFANENFSRIPWSKNCNELLSGRCFGLRMRLLFWNNDLRSILDSATRPWSARPLCVLAKVDKYRLCLAKTAEQNCTSRICWRLLRWRWGGLHRRCQVWRAADDWPSVEGGLRETRSERCSRRTRNSRTTTGEIGRTRERGRTRLPVWPLIEKLKN